MHLFRRHRGRVALLLSALLSMPACSEFETGYFRERVNEATQDAVAHRYGSPHRIDNAQDGRSVWIYYDRGSGTSSYTGYARSTYCRAYFLAFDEQGVLRDWRQDDCSGRTKPPTAPPSDRK